jgi:hypothetical protein
MTRRTSLQLLGGLASAPFTLSAAGAPVFTLQLPEGRSLGDRVGGLVVLGENLLVAHTGGVGAVSEFDTSGRHVRDWAPHIASMGESVVVTAEHVFVAAAGPAELGGIFQYGLQGQLLRIWPAAGVTSLVVHEQTVFATLASPTFHGVVEVDFGPSVPKVLRRLGKQAGVRNPGGLTRDANSSVIFFCDRGNRRIGRFGPEGVLGFEKVDFVPQSILAGQASPEQRPTLWQNRQWIGQSRPGALRAVPL